MDAFFRGGDRFLSHMASAAAFILALICLADFVLQGGSLIALGTAILAFIYIRLGGILREMMTINLPKTDVTEQNTRRPYPPQAE